MLDLLDYLTKYYSFLPRLFDETLNNRLDKSFPHLLKNDFDLTKSKIYLFRYTLTLLEVADLLNEKRWKEMLFWATVQLRIGMHLRYLDYILDNDRSELSKVELFSRSQAYFLQMHKSLRSQGYLWQNEQDAIYGQFIEIEREIQNNYSISFALLWRRVSPLCVVPETYLKSQVTTVSYKLYKDYLSLSLLYADYQDFLCDILSSKPNSLLYLAELEAQNPRKVDDLYIIANQARLLQLKLATRILDMTPTNKPLLKAIIKKVIDDLNSNKSYAVEFRQ